MLRRVFLFSLLWLSLPTVSASYTGDFNTISEARLFAHYYRPTPRLSNEVRVVIFGISSTYQGLYDDYVRSFVESNKWHNRLRGDSATDINAIDPWKAVLGVNLETDMTRWAKQNGIPRDQLYKLYQQKLLQLEDRLINEVDFVLFDVRNIRLSADGRARVNDGNVDFVRNPLERSWNAKLSDGLSDWIANFMHSDNYITSLEYQKISANPRYSEKTILSYRSVPLANEDVRDIVAKGPNRTNTEWGTKQRPTPLESFFRVHVRRLNRAASGSGCMNF